MCDIRCYTTGTMKTSGLLASFAVALLGSSIALAAPPAPTAPVAASAASPLMSQRGQAAAVRYAMKSSLGISGVKALKVTLDEQPNAFQGWVGFHAQGQQAANGMKVSVVGTMNPYKGRLMDDTGTHTISHVATVTLLDTAPKPATAPAAPAAAPASPASPAAPGPLVKTPATQTNATATPHAPANAGFAYPVTLAGKIVQVKPLANGSVFIPGLGTGRLTRGLDGLPVFRDAAGKTTQLGLKTPPHVYM